MKLTVTYEGPTVTRGSRMVVRGPEGQRSYPFPYEARDAWQHAADTYAAAFQLGTPVRAAGDVGRSTERRVFTVAQGSLSRPCFVCGAGAGESCATPYKPGHPLCGMSHATRVLGTVAHAGAES